MNEEGRQHPGRSQFGLGPDDCAHLSGIAYAGSPGGGLASVCFLLTFGLWCLAQVMPAGILLGSLAGVAVSMVRRIDFPIRAV